MTLPSLSRRQTLKELMQMRLIDLLNDKTSKKEIQGTTTKHSDKQQALDADQSNGKRRSMGQNLSRHCLAPGKSRFELFLAPLFPQVDGAMASMAYADMGCGTVSGKNSHHKGQPPGGGRTRSHSHEASEPDQPAMRWESKIRHHSVGSSNVEARGS
jgi:hypothetical protein